MDKKLVSKKLRIFAEKRFGRIKDFAEALGMAPSALQSAYLNGKSLPGAEILAKLAKMGCDIYWLLDEENIGPPTIVHEHLLSYDTEKIKILEQEKQALAEENERLRSAIGAELALLSKKIGNGKGIAKKKR